jgi:hypothetical protein
LPLDSPALPCPSGRHYPEPEPASDADIIGSSDLSSFQFSPTPPAGEATTNSLSPCGIGYYKFPLPLRERARVRRKIVFSLCSVLFLNHQLLNQPVTAAKRVAETVPSVPPLPLRERTEVRGAFFFRFFHRPLITEH